MLTLFHWEPVTSCAAALICLAEKGVEYSARYVDLLSLEQFTPAFLQLSPQAEAPVLVHGEQVIDEWTLILEYVDAAFSGVALTPESPIERYYMRAWTKHVDEYFAPAVGLLGWQHYMAPLFRGRDLAPAHEGLERLAPERRRLWRAALEGGADARQLEIARESLTLRLEWVERQLADTPWLAGARYSLADVAAFPMVRPLRGLMPEALNAARKPHTLAWLARIAARPAVRQALSTARSENLDEYFAPGPEGSRWG
jgi:glutathione S-transferase